MTESAQPQNTPAPLASERQHRRETFRQVVLPVVLGFAGLLTAIGLAAWLVAVQPAPGQLSLVADMLLIVFVLLPMVICLLPLYILLMVAAFGTGALHNASARQLRRLNRLTQTVSDRTIQVTERANRQTLALRVRLAGAEALMEGAFSENPTTNNANSNGESSSNDTADTTAN